MLRRSTAVVFLLLVLSFPGAAQAGTLKGRTLSGGCTDPGATRGYCARFVEPYKDESPYFRLDSYEGGGPVELCVIPPNRGETCISRRLHRDRKIKAWVAHISFPRIPVPTNGGYSVRWIDPSTGKRLGPRMHFLSYPNRSEGERHAPE